MEKFAFINKDYLPPMKFEIGDNVVCYITVNGEKRRVYGVIKGADLGGTLEGDRSSYNVLVENFNDDGVAILFKNIKEDYIELEE